MDAVSGPKSEIRALKPAAGPHDVIDWNGPKYYNPDFDSLERRSPKKCR